MEKKAVPEKEEKPQTIFMAPIPNTVSQEEEKKEYPSQGNTQPQDKQGNQRKVIIIIPFGTPCSGKSFMWDGLKKKIEATPNWSCESISTDEIRRQEMEKLMKSMP